MAASHPHPSQVEPFASTIREAGHREIASNFVDTHPDLSVAAYFTAEDRLAEDPELFENITEVLHESLSYAEAKPDEVRRILATYTEIDPDLIEQMALPRFPEQINEDSVQTLAELMVTDGIIDAGPDLESMIR